MTTGLYLFYVAALALTGIGLIGLATVPLGTANRTRAINGSLGAIALLYSFYLLTTPAENVVVFWYAFVLPVVLVARTVREVVSARRAAAADETVPATPEPARALAQFGAIFVPIQARIRITPQYIQASEDTTPVPAVSQPDTMAYTGAFPAGPVLRSTDLAAADSPQPVPASWHAPAIAGSTRHPSPVSRSSTVSVEDRVLAAAARYRAPRGYAAYQPPGPRHAMH